MKMFFKRAKKGSMQVDYAIALSLFIIVFSLLMSSSLKFVLPAKEISERSIMYQNLIDITNYITEDKGIFYNETNTIYMMIPIYYVFLNTTSSQERNASFSIYFPADIDESSIRVYNLSFSEVPSNLTSWNGTYANVTIQVNGHQNFLIFATTKSFTTPNYGIDMSDINNTGVSYDMTNYTFSEAIDLDKFSKFNQSNYNKTKEFLGLKHFLITIIGNDGNEKARFGQNPYPTANIYAISKPILYLNSTGSLNEGSLSVKIW